MFTWVYEWILQKVACQFEASLCILDSTLPSSFNSLAKHHSTITDIRYS